MINFEEIMTTVPPAIKSMNDAAIQRFKLDKLKLDHPCHNQAVERLTSNLYMTSKGLYSLRGK